MTLESDAIPAAAADGAITYSGLIEKSFYTKQLTGETGVPGPGVSGVYYNNIADKDGKVIGQAYGLSVEQLPRPEDGHLTASYHEVVTMPAGTLVGYAVVDYIAMVKGGWVQFPVKGLTGELAGKTGYRRWKLIGPPTDFTVEVEMALWDEPGAES
ncbi:hypothetical protein [Amycolatopsis sp. NPDC004079]|uniref:allene oxide cyclase barrel-like domain-containing protein n=1 Tax=Amycolatopsis sp. NPDC004079 TaxID=3154549 RepID=UPI0033BA83EA